MPNKPWSTACENNREPILAVLRQHFTRPGTILELGSGTGQHAVYFARHLPHLRWQPSDLPDNLPGIGLWVDEADLPNLPQPLALDVSRQRWPCTEAVGVFSANTAHIMDWDSVQRMFAGTARILIPGGVFCLYGPFMTAGRHNSLSNARFDSMLRARDPAGGLRDTIALQALADKNGLGFVEEIAMPANNRILVWQQR